MSVKFDQTSEQQSLKADGSALAPSFTSNVDGFSVSVWVYFETLPQTTGIHVVWWYGKKETGTGGALSTEWVRLEYQFSTKRFRVTNGSGYSSNVAVSQGGDDLVAGVWYLVTFVAKHDGSLDPVSLGHTLYVNTRTDSASINASSPPTVSNFNRFTLGRIGAEETEDTKPVSCLVEQAAIWDRVLSESEHDTMFEDCRRFGGAPSDFWYNANGESSPGRVAA